MTGEDEKGHTLAQRIAREHNQEIAQRTIAADTYGKEHVQSPEEAADLYRRMLTPAREFLESEGTYAPIADITAPEHYAFSQYEQDRIEFALYKKHGPALDGLYPTLGMCGEAGEIANKVKKIVRDGRGVAEATVEERAAILEECGDVLWYLAAVVADLDADLADVARHNIAKLKDRKNRGVLHGNGDKR